MTPDTEWMKDARVMAHECAIEECTNQAKARGWCNKHYERWRRHGDPTACARLPGALTGPDDPRHGTANGYHNLGCRCEACREAWRIDHLRYMHAVPERLRKHRDRQRRARAAA